MILDAPAMLVAGLAMSYIAGAEAVPCASGTVAINVTSLADVRNLTDVMGCTGGGVFDVTWYNSLEIEERIEVSDHTSVTVTGFGFPTILLIAGLTDNDDNVGVVIDLESTGIFSVLNGSSLVLKKLMIDGGRSKHGGAVAVTFSSSLYVYDCAFANNNATTGGENKA